MSDLTPQGTQWQAGPPDPAVSRWWLVELTMRVVEVVEKDGEAWLKSSTDFLTRRVARARPRRFRAKHAARLQSAQLTARRSMRPPMPRADRRPLTAAERLELARRGLDVAGLCCDAAGHVWRLGTRRRRFVALVGIEGVVASAGLRAVWSRAAERRGG